MNLYDEFAWRGMVYDATEGLLDAFARERVTAYIGFDPTASSLHVGSLLPVMALARLQRFGHVPIAIVGGGTGMIGDPSGKSQERTLLSNEQIDENMAGLRQQLSRFLDFDRVGNAVRARGGQTRGSSVSPGISARFRNIATSSSKTARLRSGDA